MLADLGLVEHVGARLHPWLPPVWGQCPAVSCLPGERPRAFPYPPPALVPWPVGSPLEGSPGGAGATQQAGTREPTSPSKIHLSPGVLAELPACRCFWQWPGSASGTAHRSRLT